MILRASLCALATLLITPAYATAPNKTDVKLIAIGESHSFLSQVMGEDRTINIYLPASYSDTSRKYPVLYVIDGGLDQDFMHVVGTSHLGALLARSQEVIVVGIATKDRRKELIAPTGDPELLRQYPQVGYSVFFRKHIAEEVKPFIERSYRVNGQDALIGESLAGMFVVETYLKEPGLFGAYGAISPSLWWDGERLAKQTDKLVKAQKKGVDPRIFVTLANEGGEMEDGVDRFIRAISRRKNWCYAPDQSLRHDTIYHQSMAAALQFLFPTDALPGPESGFVIKCSKKS